MNGFPDKRPEGDFGIGGVDENKVIEFLFLAESPEVTPQSHDGVVQRIAQNHAGNRNKILGIEEILQFQTESEKENINNEKGGEARKQKRKKKEFSVQHQAIQSCHHSRKKHGRKPKKIQNGIIGGEKTAEIKGHETELENHPYQAEQNIPDHADPVEKEKAERNRQHQKALGHIAHGKI